MIRFILCLICFSVFGTASTTTAQDVKVSRKYRPGLAVKFVPLPLIDYTPALQFGVEVGTFKNQSVELEYGYVFNLHSYRNPNADFTGYKLKATYRWFPFKEESGARNMFFALQYMNKRVVTSGMDVVWRANRTYQEIMELDIVNQTNAFFIMSGFVFPVGKKFRFETALGLGGRFLNVGVDNVPDDVEYDGDLSTGFFNPVIGEGDYGYPALIISGKVVYQIF